MSHSDFGGDLKIAPNGLLDRVANSGGEDEGRGGAQPLEGLRGQF